MEWLEADVARFPLIEAQALVNGRAAGKAGGACARGNMRLVPEAREAWQTSTRAWFMR